jgi:hypothetical protein
MANQTVTITNGCCNPNEVIVLDGDTVTWSTSDARSYVVTPPPGVFSSNAAIPVPANGSGTSPSVTGSPSSAKHTYSVNPGCDDRVAPDIVIDGSPEPEATDTKNRYGKE